jgi:hypothetical protein
MVQSPELENGKRFRAASKGFEVARCPAYPPTGVSEDFPHGPSGKSRGEGLPVECPGSTIEFKPFRLAYSAFSSLMTACRTANPLPKLTRRCRVAKWTEEICGKIQTW